MQERERQIYPPLWASLPPNPDQFNSCRPGGDPSKFIYSPNPFPECQAQISNWPAGHSQMDSLLYLEISRAKIESISPALLGFPTSWTKKSNLGLIHQRKVTEQPGKDRVTIWTQSSNLTPRQACLINLSPHSCPLLPPYHWHWFCLTWNAMITSAPISAAW